MSSIANLLGPVIPVAIGAGVLILLAAAVVALRQGKSKSTGFKPSYVRRDAMTETELKFFRRLVEALPEAVVAPQVAMSALVDVPPEQGQGKQGFINRAKFSQQRLDYVVFDRKAGGVVCVIELDDRTHDGATQKAKDAKRDAILEGVGYAVLRFDARQMPTAAQLREHFSE